MSSDYVVLSCVFVFFVKQKTAYEMRISDWSSDVCSSVSLAGELTSHRMSDRAVARLVQRCAASAGLDPAKFAGHSLRSGFLTEAARGGASIFKNIGRASGRERVCQYV